MSPYQRSDYPLDYHLASKVSLWVFKALYATLDVY